MRFKQTNFAVLFFVITNSLRYTHLHFFELRLKKEKFRKLARISFGVPRTVDMVKKHTTIQFQAVKTVTI